MAKISAPESQLFADCLLIGKLVDKLGKSTQISWYHNRAVHLGQPEGVSCKDWLVQEGRAAVHTCVSILLRKGK